MRSARTRAVVAGSVTLLSLSAGCGGGNEVTPPENRPPPEGVDIGGTVTDPTAGPVAHGAMELWDAADTTLLDRVLIDEQGGYRFSEVPAGDYRLRLQPAEGYQLSAEERAADPRPVTVGGDALLTEDFTVEPGWWVERFTQYRDSEDLRNRFPDPAPPGAMLAQLRILADPVEAVLDPGVGPTGGPAYRMDYRRGDGAPTYEDCDQTTGSQGLQVLFPSGAPEAGSEEWWMRFVTREGGGPDDWFPVGNEECCTTYDPPGPFCDLNYKYIRLFIGGTELGWAHSSRGMPPPDELDQSFDFNSGGLGIGRWEPPDDPADWQGQWALWVVHLDLRAGTGNARYRIWRQRPGTTEMMLLHDVSGAFAGSDGVWTSWQLPGPMNEWPGRTGGDPVQRWWALIGFYQHRPATIPMDLLVP